MNGNFKNTRRFESKKKQQLFELLLKDRGIELPLVSTIPRSDTAERYPLSSVQERLWYEWQQGISPAISNEVILLELQGQLITAALIEAFNEVIRRHEILRTRFVEIGGQLWQAPCLQVKLDLSVIDLGHLSIPEQESSWRLLVDEQINSSFNLEQPPLIRGEIIVLSPNSQLLMLTMHKIICDAWSRKILIKELGRLYESYSKGEKPELPELEIQYGDFAYWQRASKQSGEFNHEIEFWREKLLSKSSPMPFITDYTEQSRRKSNQSSCEVNLSEQVSERLRHIVHQSEITAYMLLLAGWQTLIGRHRGQQEVTVATMVANRGRSELEGLIGPVANIVLIKLNLNGNPSFATVLANVKKEVLTALEHQELPYEWLVPELLDSGDQTVLFTPDLMFIMEESLDERLEFGDLKIISKKLEQTLPDAGITALMRQNGERFEGRIVFSNTSLNDKAAELAGQYERLVETVAADLNCRIGNLPPLSD